VDLFPSIDLRDGRVVRLLRGDYDRETAYGDDPVGVAESFAAAGARWIHVVDLDAARTGEPRNRPAIAAIAAAVGVPVQTGGGVRSEEAADALFAAGVARVVVGTAAVEDPGLVARLAGGGRRVAVGLDVRGREVAVRGWREGSGHDLFDLLDRFAGGGAEAVVVTQIHVDGTLEGPDLDGLAAVLDATSLDVVASGGVGSLDDLRRLAGLRGANGRELAGAIVGRAIYERRFSPEQAVEMLKDVR
jgi:phosphoribosylformimino-5-aminoimidazole carboxamide ribotide isomerase